MSAHAPAISDFRALFESAPDLYLVLSPGLTIVGASDAYLRATLTKREEIVGRGLFEVFPDNPDDPAATGVANLRSSLERVKQLRRPDVMAIQKYDIRRPESEGGGFEERHWSPLNSPVFDASGELAYILHRVEDVTSRVLLERRAHEQDRTIAELTTRAEERYRALLETAPDAMIVVDARSRIDFVNQRAEAMFGYSRDELIGQSLELLVPEHARPAHARHVERFIASPSARPMMQGAHLTGRRRDGSELSIDVSLSPLRTEEGIVVSAAIRDVSERVRVEQERRLAAERLTSAVDSIQSAFALFDAEGRLIQCNSTYRRIVGEVLTGPLLGMTHADIVEGWSRLLVFPDAEARDRFCAEQRERRRERRAAYDVRALDGRSLRVTDRQTPEGGLVEVITDITEDALREDELRVARRAAEEGSAAKSEFVSSMSHELRTPLNAILGFAQLLQRDRKQPLDARQAVRVGHILKGGEHLLRLIDDVLDLARIEARRLTMSIEAVGVPEVVQEVKTTIEPMAARAEIEVVLASMPIRLPEVEADRTRFAQILMNFASNAVKYNRHGGSLTFAVTQPRPGRVRVTVSDTGLGIPRDKQARMFQPFHRAGQEAGPIEGTGIGLAISKRLVEMMGGDIGFESSPGEGSSFWVELPEHAHLAPTPAPEHPTQLGASLAAAGSGQRVVLYVEDNPANVAFMEEFLSGFDAIDLVVAPTAEIGVELARTRRPHAIIMDINLPGMSGLDALRKLRGDPETADIPVIALTAAATERDRERGEQAGFFRYMTKPVQVAELEDALVKLLAAEP